MSYLTHYFVGRKVNLVALKQIAHIFDNDRYDGDKSVFFIPEKDRYKMVGPGDYTGGKTAIAIDNAIYGRWPNEVPDETVLMVDDLSDLAFCDYTDSGIEESIRELLDVEVKKILDQRYRLREAEFKESMSQLEIRQLLRKYPYYAPRLISEYDEFFHAVMKWNKPEYYPGLSLAQMLQIICEHADGEHLRLLPNGRNVFPLCYPGVSIEPQYNLKNAFIRFVVTFNQHSNRWYIEAEKIGTLSSTDLKDVKTRLFWLDKVPL